jgi:hypothetical protein
VRKHVIERQPRRLNLTVLLTLQAQADEVIE